MNRSVVRTTIDLDQSLYQDLREFAARHNQSQKQIISRALSHFMHTEAKHIDAQTAWQRIRQLATSGAHEVNLTQALRQDRLR
jgi:predicted transcriptional regulator